MQHTRLFETPGPIRESWQRVIRAKWQKSRRLAPVRLSILPPRGLCGLSHRDWPASDDQAITFATTFLAFAPMRHPCAFAVLAGRRQFFIHWKSIPIRRCARFANETGPVSPLHQQDEPYASTHRMRSAYSLSLFVRGWSFLTKPRREPKQEKPDAETWWRSSNMPIAC